jgi:hypothetical protein
MFGIKPWRERIEFSNAEETGVWCAECGHTVILPSRGVRDWANGQHVQNAMPKVSPDDREVLLSGWCGPCFDRKLGG